ncbi:hypothetical protein [Aquimarina rhabdastrellae]
MASKKDREQLLKELLEKDILKEEDKEILKTSLEELFERELKKKEQKLNQLILRRELIKCGIDIKKYKDL